MPDYFVDAQALEPADHLVMQAAVQRHVDSSISKTINCPEGISFESFKDIYQQAYDLGCKGCTTYRPNVVTGAVLQAKPGSAKGDQPELPLVAPKALARPRDAGVAPQGARSPDARSQDAGAIVYMTQPLDRPEVLQGGTYKVRWPETDHAMYITINDVIQDGRRRPFEVFINSKNMEHFAWTVALTRMISAVFRRGGDVSFVVEELKAVFDPRGGQWMDGRYVPSLLAAIGEVIERHMIAIGFLNPPATSEAGEARIPKIAAGGGEAPAPSAVVGRGDSPAATLLRQCPKCAEAALIRQEGCDVCTSCTYSKCA